MTMDDSRKKTEDRGLRILKLNKDCHFEGGTTEKSR